MRGLLIALLVFAFQPAKVRGDDVATAERRNADGRAAYDRGEFREALAAFKEAYRASPQPRFLFNASKACLRLEDPEAALHYGTRYLAAAPDAEDRDTVEAEQEALRRDLRARGLVRLAVRSEPPGAAFAVDGLAHPEIPAAPAERWLPPGERVVTASLEGRTAARETVRLEPGTDTELLLVLPPLRATGRLVVSAPPGARVEAAGRTLEPGTELEVPAGPVTVRVLLAGHRDWVEEATVTPGMVTSVTADPLPLPPPPGRGRARRIAGWTGVALGATALVAGAALMGEGSRRMAAANQRYDHADADYVRAFGLGRDLFHGGVGALAGAGAAALTGSLLLILAPGD